MTNVATKINSYDESKLIQKLNTETNLKEGQQLNDTTCIQIMKNLGQLSAAAKDKEINVEQYNTLISCIARIFNMHASLTLRILSLKVLTNSALILNARQHTNTSSAAYSLIIKEIGNEVGRPNISVSFLITIFDAIFLCSQAGCIDDKATIQALLQLSKIKNLPSGSRDSLAVALDIDLVPFNQNYKYGAQAKEMNILLQQLGCTRLLSDSQASSNFTIPQPLQITSIQQRLAAQEFLMQLSPADIADRVIDGFAKFKKPENFRPADTIADLISSLIEGPEDDLDQQTSITDATVYMVEQALDRLQQRIKYIPLQMQSEFIAMLITTLDSTQEGFDECKGPATTAAIKHAIDPNQILVPFLAAWVSFEYVRSSEKRYENLVITIFTQLVCLETLADTRISDGLYTGDPVNMEGVNEDENYLLDFIKNLDCIPLELYNQLGQLCSSHTNKSDKILNAVNEYVTNAPASQKYFLHSLLELCVHPLETVHLHAIEIIRTYYKRRIYVEEINKFAIENLDKGVKDPNPGPFFELFFAIMELDFSLFINLMEAYNISPLPLLRNKLKQKIPTMQYKIDVIAQALEIAPESKNRTVLMHIYLSELAKRLSVPPDLVELLKTQFQTQNDSRYLIPIIPYLTEDEFKKFLPNILMLESHGLRRAINSLLTAGNKPVMPVFFLIELHKPSIAEENLPKAIEAMQICFELKDVFDYQISISAVEVVIRNKYHDLIMYTLLQMVKTFPTSHKYVLYHLVPQLVNNGITQLEEPWKLLKKLLYETKPTSCKPALQLPAEKVKDLIDTYPDYKSLLVGLANQTKGTLRATINPTVLEVVNS